MLIKDMIKNNFVTLYIITSILLIAGTNYNMAMDCFNLTNDCITPQDKIFFEFLALHNQQLPETDEQIFNDDNTLLNNISKKRPREVHTPQNQQQPYKKQKTWLQKPICPQCNKIFSSTRNLREHFITHSDERPFICPHCNKTFKRKDTLRKHKARKHEHKKNFNCSSCKKKFFSKLELTAHERNHTGEKIHCTHKGCLSTFISNSNLSLHIKKYHT